MGEQSAGGPGEPLIALRERVKELTALHEAARLIQHDHLDLATLANQIARLIPPSFLHPDRTAAAVRHGDIVCATPDFRETPWMLKGTYVTRGGVAGGIDVAYAADAQSGEADPFLEEERHLLDSLTEMFRLAAQRRESDAEAGRHQAALEQALAETRAERDRSALLLRLTNAMASTLDLRVLCTRISELLRETVPHMFANLALWDEDARVLRRAAVIGAGVQTPGDFREGSIVQPGWPADVVFRRGETVLFDHLRPDEIPPELLSIAGRVGMRCACGVPLQTARNRLGALVLGSSLPGPFPDAERRLLEQIAPQFAMAIENAQHFERAERFRAQVAAQRDRLQLLLDLTNAVASELNLPALLSTISDLLRSKVQHHYASLTLWDREVGQLRRHALVFPTSRNVIQQADLAYAGAPPTRAFNAGQTMAFRWKDIQAIGGRTLEVMEAEGLRAGVCIVLQTPRAKLGTLNVARPDDEAFPDDEIRLLEQIGQQLAIAIENAMHFEDAERFRREAAAGRDRLQLLLDVNNAIVSHLEPRQLRISIFAALRRAIAHDYAGLSLVDRDSGELRLEAVTRHDAAGLFEPHTVVPLDRTPTGLAFRDRETKLFDPAAIAAIADDIPHILRGASPQYACGVPLLTGRGAVGALAIGRTTPQPFTPEDVALLNEVAGQIAIAVENTNAYGEIAALKDRLAEEKTYLQDELTEHADFAGIIGHSAGLRQVLHHVRTVAPTDATVLLLGETGTGKEVIARAVHSTSRRRDQTFVRVNAAAIPTALFESELFGYERGAFTGAVGSKIGRIELAHRGTLFLDEIGDLPLDLQPKLLRALQEHEFERLGSARTHKVDIRLVAATNRDLEQMVEAGTFRSDLFYRLSVFPIRLPPLRERREDIQPLVWHFVRKFSAELGRTITAIPVGAMSRLVEWDWPGNIRELQNVIERAVILSPGPALDVPESAFQSKAPPPPAPAGGGAGTLQQGEKEIILRALREAGGIVGGPTGAAAKLGVKRTTLAARMKKLGIARPTY